MRARAYCPKCNLVDHVDSRWRCLWCETLTMGGDTAHAPRVALFASVAVVREAHRLHAEGMTVQEAAEATIGGTGYRNVSGYCMTLRGAWALLGLPVRPRTIAQAIRARGEHPPRTPNARPTFRADVDDAELAAHYAASRSTVKTAAAFRMSQAGVYERLKRLGVLKSQIRRAQESRTLG